MTPDKMRAKVLAERIEWTKDMLRNLRLLPLTSYDSFIADQRNIAAAESFLRRALEAIMDIGRHVLAKSFAIDVSDYKSIAVKLGEMHVIDKEIAEKMRLLAGYRNRMVHFYNEISEKELYEICSAQLGDVESVLHAIITWLNENPQRIDEKL